MYKFILATRYLIKRRITYLAMLSVCLCVFMVVVVMTVMAGLVNDFKTENHQWVGDCVISSDSLVGFPYYQEFLEILDRLTFVEASSPVVQTYGILTPGSSDRNAGIEIMGFDPERHCHATNFGQTIHYHKDDCANVFKPDYNPNLPGCVLAIDKAVARDSRGRYWQEPKIPVASVAVSCFPLTPKGTLAKAGLGLVNTKTFYYSDNSRSGLAKVDNSFIYIPLDEAQLLCGMAGTEKRINAIHIKFKLHTNLDSGCREVAKLWTAFVATKKNQQWASLLDSVSVQSWKGFRRDVIAAVETEQMMMTVAFGMIGIIAVFIVFVVFYMIVSHKTKDIGILKSIGVSDENVVGLFLGFALMVGVLSSAAGAFLGWLFLMNINKIEDILFERFGFQLWDRTFYAIGEIPSNVDVKVLVAVMLSAVFVCLIGAFIPSRQAAKLQPVETLRVERL